MIKLTPEQAQQVTQHPSGVECKADGLDKTFVIVDAAVLRRMRTALYQKDVHTSIAEGIADVEVGLTTPVADAERHVRKECGLSPHSET